MDSITYFKVSNFCSGLKWNVHSIFSLTLLHSERPKLYAILAFLSAIGLTKSFSH